MVHYNIQLSDSVQMAADDGILDRSCIWQYFTDDDLTTAVADIMGCTVCPILSTLNDDVILITPNGYLLWSGDDLMDTIDRIISKPISLASLKLASLGMSPRINLCLTN